MLAKYYHIGISLTYLVFNMLMRQVTPKALACNILMIEDRYSALCTNRGLNSIPKSLPVGINAMHFENNSLTILHDNDLQNFGALRYLYLGHNKISEIEHEAFFGVRNLLALDLEGNKLQSVPYSTLHDLRSLVYLNLKHNPLKKINVYSFPGLPMLERLELAHCHIADVHPKAFLGLNSLKELNLAHNKITYLDSEMHETLSHSLRTLRLYGNPWKCDCYLRWLKVWLMMANLNWVFGDDVPQCSEPHGLQGGRWNKIQIDFFACLPTIWPKRAKVASSVTENVTISCHVYSHPKGKIRWFKDKKLIREESLYSVITPGDGDYNFTTELTIINTNKNNSGVYQCEASNFAGRVIADITVGIVSPDDPLKILFDTGAIVGLVVAGAVILIMICLTIILCRRKQRRRTYAAKKSVTSSPSNTSELMYTGRRDYEPAEHKNNSPSTFKIQANPFYTDPYRFPQPEDKDRQRVFIQGNENVSLRSPMKHAPSPVTVPSDYVTIRPNPASRDWSSNQRTPYENDYHWSSPTHINSPHSKPVTFRPYSTFSNEGLNSGDEESRTHSLDSFQHRSRHGSKPPSSIDEDEGATSTVPVHDGMSTIATTSGQPRNSGGSTNNDDRGNYSHWIYGTN